MSNIKASLSKHQPKDLLDENIYRVEVVLDTDIADIQSISWSFECVDPHSQALLHSGNAEEMRFLRYSNMYQPLIEIKTPNDNSYSVIVHCKIYTFTNKEITVYDVIDDTITEIL